MCKNNSRYLQRFDALPVIWWPLSLLLLLAEHTALWRRNHTLHLNLCCSPCWPRRPRDDLTKKHEKTAKHIRIHSQFVSLSLKSWGKLINIICWPRRRIWRELRNRLKVSKAGVPSSARFRQYQRHGQKEVKVVENLKTSLKRVDRHRKVSFVAF